MNRRLTLYSRSWCHLCDEMLGALDSLPTRKDFELEVVDVDSDEALVAAYDELVPVLVGQGINGEPVRICHYFLDAEALERFLKTPY